MKGESPHEIDSAAQPSFSQPAELSLTLHYRLPLLFVFQQDAATVSHEKSFLNFDAVVKYNGIEWNSNAISFKKG